MSKFLSGVGMFGASIASTILRGYTLSVLWAWFIVTTFQAPTINIPSAIGMDILAALLTKSHNRADSEREDAVKFNMTVGILWPLTALTVGWIVKQFM